MPPFIDPNTGTINNVYIWALIGFMLGTVAGGELMRKIK